MRLKTLGTKFNSFHCDSTNIQQVPNEQPTTFGEFFRLTNRGGPFRTSKQRADKTISQRLDTYLLARIGISNREAYLAIAWLTWPPKLGRLSSLSRRRPLEEVSLALMEYR